MRKTALAIALLAAITLPGFAADMMGMGLSLGVGANRDLMDAGYTAADLSVGARLSLLPIRIDDLAAGVTIRATAGWSVISDEVIIGWYALTPLLTLAFSDMSISVGYGPYAYAEVPDVYLYGPAVLLGFEDLEIGFVGATVFVGFGFSF